MAHLTIQRWDPDGENGAIVTHSPSTQLQPPAYEDPALSQRSSETWRNVASLGSGAFGSVMLQECLESGTGTTRPLRAVKKIVEPRCCLRHISLHGYSVKNETRANSIFPKERPALFVQCFGWYEREAAIYICLEYMPLGNLSGCIDRAIPEVDVLEIVKQIFRGIQYLHEQGCCHGDIRPPNILVASRPPAPEGWQVKIADFGICVFEGDPGHAPWRDVQQAYDIVLDRILSRVALPMPGMVAAGVVGAGGYAALHKTGLSEVCVAFTTWCAAEVNGRPTAAGALDHPWMQLRNWGDWHRLTSVARRAVSPDGSLGVATESGSRYAFVNTDSLAWGIGIVGKKREFRWASLTSPQTVARVGDSVVSMAPEIWESDGSRDFSPAHFLTVGGFWNEEADDGMILGIRQSTHPTKSMAVFSADRYLIEYNSAGQMVGHLALPGRILSMAYSPDGRRLLVALDAHLRILQCDAITGLRSSWGRNVKMPYPCRAAEISAVAILSRKGAVAVGTESGQIWLGMTTSRRWARGHWAMIHDVSMEVPGPYLSMRFSPRGDKIVAVSGSGGTVVSVSSAGSLPMGRVSRKVPGAFAATLSPDNDRVFVAGWDPEAGWAWTEEFAITCLADGCGECTETRPLNEFW